MSNNASTGLTCPIPSRFELSEDTYSQTPGGTLFSTTPGGTRIIYDRKFLLDCRNSPIARTPPSCLPHIPGVTMLPLHPLGKLKEMDENKDHSADEALFVIDI
ncbi:hypothetical protein DPEC_G00227680 [Dallia pectoralis]|uniref:Uncharacterized protein n=1 Tax=Dallia pectoralis TaxID=75939 RepID=A0ACC2G0Q4_DALPE|nr:hypothetical protein DPEC_G00227680 [Dallia pectoralis]